MKKKIAVILLMLFVISCFIMAFTACGNNDNNDDITDVGSSENLGNGEGSGNTDNGGNTEQRKRVPIYQGMTITNSNTAISLTSASYRSGEIMLLSANSENNGNNGNHYGHYKGDHADRDDVVDNDNPYPDNSDSENIEEEIKSSLNVVGATNEIYYATQNQDVYINIHIYNPDNFEILSFTLNGKKYSSYMFEEGSDMETIVLKYNVGAASGIVEYTIDAIKYIDGTEIKDVIIDGNKTVMAGIKTENQIAANITGVNIGSNALAFNVNIKDNNALVEFSNGALKTVLYDGFSIVAEKDLHVGDNTVSFDGLKTNTLYQYAVIGYYDDLSGDGFGMNVLYKDAFYTNSVVLFDNITIGQESISFSFLWHEDHQGKAISALKLYKGDAFVKDVAADATSISELFSNTTYKLVAEYPNGNSTESIYIEFTTLAKATPEISVVSPTKTQTSVGFEIGETDADNVGAVTKIELVHANGTVVADSLDQRTFANLLSNNAYTVKVTYVYNLNDGEGEHTVTKELAITTLAKATPEISVVSPTKTQTSVGFEISETDADNVGAVIKIELVHANGTVVADSLDQRTFANLLSNNAYTVKVTYVYDLNDGEGEQTVTKELVITTLAKAAPIFNIKNENITTNSINARYGIIDVDNILFAYKVELYKGTTLVLENIDKEIDFAGLDYYTDYTVRITYTYNLNDGNGNQTEIQSYDFKTLPYIDVTGCSIANTSAVSEGETIFMSVNLDNPLGMTIESVVINGEMYNVTGASTKNKIFVEIIYNAQFAGGDTHLKIDNVNAKIDNTALTVEPKTELSDNVFINGKLEVLKIEFINDEFEKIDYVLGDTPVYVLITFSNPTGYNIDKIRVNDKEIVDLTKIDDNHWCYRLYWNYSDTPAFTIENVSYSNKYIQKTISAKITSDGIMLIADETPVYVSTPEDLKNMSELRYYILTNDIDLSGMEWRGNSFYGVLEGNGYSIKNMSFVGIVNDQSARLGLFSGADGIIRNLHIKNATLIVDYKPNEDENTPSIYSGFFAGTGNACFNNCTVDAASVLNVKYPSVGLIECYAGGFVGRGVENSFINCSNSGSVSAKYAGGLIGLVGGNSQVTIIKSTNSGGVSGKCAGGLIGYVYSSSQANITNSTNSGSVSSTRAGGLIGSGGDGGQVTIINSYSLVSGNGSYNGKTCTVEQLNSKEFYTKTLGWSEDVWDFSELDVENGKYPRLKQ